MDDFVEEFDTSSSDSDSNTNSIVTKNSSNSTGSNAVVTLNTLSASEEQQHESPYVPTPIPSPYDAHIMPSGFNIPFPYAVNFDSYAPQYYYYNQLQQPLQYPPNAYPPVYQECFATPYPPPPHLSQISNLTCSTPLQPLPPGVSQSFQFNPDVQGRKRKCKNSKIKLSDYEDGEKKSAWLLYQKQYLKKQIENSAAENEIVKTRQQILLLESECSKEFPMKSLHSDSTVRKIAHKILTQKRKRKREKKLKVERQQEKMQVMKRREEVNKQIDDWQSEQSAIREKEKKEKLFESELKKCLKEVLNKRKLIQDRIDLLQNIKKLRDVRQKQRVNVKLGSAGRPTPKADQKFTSGIVALKQMLEKTLISITEEEETLRLMSQQHHCANDQPKSLAVTIPLQVETNDNSTNEIEEQRNVVVENDEKMRKDRKENKWKKWLRKKDERMKVDNNTTAAIEDWVRTIFEDPVSVINICSLRS